MIDTSLFFGPVGITLVLGCISIVLLYWSSVRHYRYWTKRGIPSAETIPIFGSLLNNFLKPIQYVDFERYKKFGRLYGHFEASKPALSVAEPELLKKIFVKDFSYFHDRRSFNTGDKILDNMLTALQGEDWKRIRSIVTPTFSTGKIKRVMNIFKECSRTLVQNFRTASEAGEYINAKRLYGAFTMDVIASSAFSTKIDSHNDPDNKLVSMARKIFSVGISWKLIVFALVPSLVKLFRINVFDKEVTDFFRELTYQIVEERRKSGKKRNDFLQLLMDTAKEVSDEEKWDTQDNEKGDITSNYGGDGMSQHMFKTVTSKYLSMDELVAQCVIFFLAGYDTTASTLSLATHSLAIHPEIQDKLRKEVDEVLEKSNGELTYEGIQEMKYLDNVISETLRLYPPLSRLERTATSDYELGDTGITIKKGMAVTIPAYAIHRDPEYYPDPETFDPERFTPEERNSRVPYTYMPFGVGPRNCVAMRFALMEVKMCLAHVVANFIIKRCPETKEPVEFAMSTGLIQPKKIIVAMEIRKASLLTK